MLLSSFSTAVKQKRLSNKIKHKNLKFVLAKCNAFECQLC